MAIFGVALLALCMLAGDFIGDILGVLLHVKANVGGVGIAMLMLIAARHWLNKRGMLSHGMKLGVEFWAALYIPIVVAMASQQNVVAAVDGGPMVLIAGFGTVFLCLVATALLGRWGGSGRVSKPDAAAAAHAERVLGGDPE